MKYNKGKRIGVFLMIFLLLFAVISEGMTACDLRSLINIKGFYKEKKNSLDVVMIGASEVYSGYSAPLAWEEYGYTSYNLAVSGVPGNLYKSMLREVIKKQNPKLVVFDINTFMREEDYFDREGKWHTWLDNIPWSKNKIDTIREIVPREKRYSYYFRIATHHDNWKRPVDCIKYNVTKLLIKIKGGTYTKGFATKTKVMSKHIGRRKSICYTARAKSCMEDLLKFCKKEQVENVLFVCFPYNRRIKNPKVLKEIEKQINAYDYRFLNLNALKNTIGINRKKDYYNMEHLNVNGMEKMTKYLGQYIIDHYPVKGNHSKKIQKSWDECAKVVLQLQEQCKKDIEKGIARNYSEISLYFKPRVIKREYKKAK